MFWQCQLPPSPVSSLHPIVLLDFAYLGFNSGSPFFVLYCVYLAIVSHCRHFPDVFPLSSLPWSGRTCPMLSESVVRVWQTSPMLESVVGVWQTSPMLESVVRLWQTSPMLESVVGVCWTCPMWQSGTGSAKHSTTVVPLDHRWAKAAAGEGTSKHTERSSVWWKWRIGYWKCLGRSRLFSRWTWKLTAPSLIQLFLLYVSVLTCHKSVLCNTSKPLNPPDFNSPPFFFKIYKNSAFSCFSFPIQSVVNYGSKDCFV